MLELVLSILYGVYLYIVSLIQSICVFELVLSILYGVYLYIVSLIQSICVLELITRTVKRLYKIYIQGVEVPGLSAAISHFLNCLLGSYPTPHTPVAAEEVR